MEKQNASNGHDRGAAGQNGGDRRERPAFLKKQEECDRSPANADASENGIENSLRAGLLIPTARQPKEREVN